MKLQREITQPCKVFEENGQVIEKKRECVADIEADAYLPKSYISAPHLRMEMYKKIARIETDEDYVDITDELIDRFGDIPETAENLCRIAVTRAIAAACGITKLQAKNGEVVMTPDLIDPEVWLTVEQEYP
jgi:transcription-repair coupling factor (superfamily II helicase)